MITLHVNGVLKAMAATTLQEAMWELGFIHAAVATALNGEMVPAGARSTTALQAGDTVEILIPSQGG